MLPTVVLSGMLTYYTWHGELIKKKGRLPFGKFAVLRYLRTLPVLIATLLILWAWPTHWADGPMYRPAAAKIMTECVDYGIYELTAMSDFVPPAQMVSV